MAMDRTVRSVFRNWSRLFSPAARKRRAHQRRRHARNTQSAEYLEDRTLLAVNTFVFNLGSNTAGDIDIFSDTAAGDIHRILTDTNVTTGSGHDNGFNPLGIEIRAVPGENNVPPVAADDVLETTENATLMANVFAPNPTVPDVDPNIGSLVVDADEIRVVSVNGSDANVGQAFTLAGGSQLTVFSDGDLLFTPAAALNSLREGENATEAFTYTIADMFGEMDSAAVTINITGQNDAPTINDATFSIDESAADTTSVGTPVSSDPDAGDVLSYQITAGNVGTAFAIDSATGEISVNDTNSIDFEVSTSFSLQVEVSDGSLTDMATVTININDIDEFVVSPVVDVDTAGDEVDENAADGTTVGITASATDMDATNSAVTFSLTDDAGGRFTIDPMTGVVTVADGTLLDREDAASHDITIQAMSEDGSMSSAMFTIMVNDLVEFGVTGLMDIDVTANAVNENAADTSTVGVTFDAMDADDTMNAITFTLTDDAGGRFAVDSMSGVVTVADGMLLDREDAASHDITVEAMSEDGSTAELTVTINVNDVNEFAVTAPVDTDATANLIDENATDGTAVGVTASSTDADATTNTVTYSLADDAGGRFTIDPMSGVVTLLDGSLLDRETDTSHDITIQADSSDGSNAQAMFTITVSDMDEFDVTGPVDIDPADNEVDEDAMTGDTVGITAMAADDDQSNSMVTFSLTDDAGGRFTIDPMTGVVTVANAALLDRETDTSHTIVVRATSEDTSFSENPFTISVNDVNEFNVTDPSDVDATADAVAENSPNGTTVGITASAVDMDDTNNTVTFTLVDTAGGRFAIDSMSGVVTVANGTLLDREMAASHDIMVRADSTDGSMSQVVTFTIAINDVIPEVAPGQIFTVAEGTPNTTSVGTVALTTPAVNDNASVQFAITGGNDTGAFAINSTSGEITVANDVAIDAEVVTQFNLTVQVMNVGSAVSTTETVDVNVTPVGVTIDDGQVFNLAENATNSTSVGTVQTTGDMTSVTFAITAGNDSNIFSINSSTGEITLLDTSLTDFEDPTADQFILTVTATDSSGTDADTITIDVTDAQPAIIPGQSFTVSETDTTGTVVGTVAFDPTADTTPRTFSIDEASNPNSAFAIDSVTGQITVNNATGIDFELGSPIPLDVEITDGTTIVTETVTINIMNEIEEVNLSISGVAEEENGGTVVTVTATASSLVSGNQTVDLGVSGFGITAGDFVLSDTQITIADGTSSGSVTFTVTNDQRLEGDETATLTISNPTAGIFIGATPSQTVTIVDNEVGQINVMDAADAEGTDQTVSATLTIFPDGTGMAGLDRDLMVDISDLDSAGNGTATSGVDYNAFPTQSLTIFTGDGTSIMSTTTILDVLDDAVVEDNETVNLAIGNLSDTLSGQVSIAVSNNLLTLTDNDTATLSLDDVMVTESDDDQTVTFTASVDAAVQGGFSLAFASIGGGTAELSDFAVTTPSPLTFTGTAGESQTFSVTVTGDDIVEADETYLIQLGDVTGTSAIQDAAITTGATGTGTIVNDDTANVTVDNVTVTEPDAAQTTTASFTVTVDSVVEGGFDLAVSTSDGTATVAGSDYSNTSSILNFAGTLNETQSFTVDVTGDGRVEADEVFNAVLGSLSNIDPTAADDITVSSTAGIGTITNDDTASLSITSDVTLAEGFGVGTTDFVFTVTLDNDVQGGFDVAYTANDGTATAAGNDYVDNDGSLSFTGNAGETQTITVTVNDDTAIEPNETFTVLLGALSSIDATAADDISVPVTPGTGTINNDDSANLSIDDVTMTEGTGAGPTNFVFTVTLDRDVQNGLTVQYTTNDGSGANGATVADGDYIDNDGLLTFTGTAGETQTITVVVPHDSKVEMDEQFTVLLGAVSDPSVMAQVTPGDGVINNDDSISVQFSSSAASDAENTGGNLPVVQYTGTIQTGVTVNVDVEVTGTTAEAGDFTSPGTIAIAGDDMAHVNESLTSAGFTVVNDGVVEPNETVTLGFNTMSTPNVTPAGTTSHTYTIVNDDTATLQIDTTVSVAENAGNATFNVTLDNLVEGGLTLPFSTTGSTAVAGSDYTHTASSLTFSGTIPNDTMSFNVPILDDSVVEPDETFSAVLGTLTGIDPTAADDITVNGTSVATITNEDAIDVQFNVSSGFDDENSGGGLPFVRYTGTIQTGHSVDIDVVVAGGTATPNDDFTMAGTINVPGDGTLHTLENVGIGLLQISPDTIVEDDESIILGFDGTPVNVNPTTITTHSYSINNDDTATLTIDDVTVTESDTDQTVSFTVTSDAAVQGGFTAAFNANLVAGTAEGTDFNVDTLSPLTFAGTVNESQTVTVTIAGDDEVEADETFVIELGTVSSSSTEQDNSIVNTDTGTGTIVNDDTAMITIADVTQDEETATTTFTVTLSNDVEGGFMLPFTVNDGTATVANNDFTVATGSPLTFTGTSGETQQISVSVNDDLVVEADETFTVQLGTPTAIDATANDDITVQSTPATGTITNTDAAMLSVSDISSSEGTGGGPTNMTFTITLNADVQDGFTLGFTTDDLTATAGSDYIDNDSTMIFAGNQGETQQVTVQVLHDSIVEEDEMFRLRLASLTNIDSTAADDIAFQVGGGTGTINNDDTANVTINNVMSTEGTGGGSTSFVFTATLDNNVQGGFDLVYSTADGTAIGGDDYTAVSGDTVSFSGNLGETQTITVIGTHDGVVEPDETFAVTLDSVAMFTQPATGGIVLGADGTGTIENDDTIDVQFTAAASSAFEEANNNFPVVQYSGTIQDQFVVNIPVILTGGTATEGSDFTAPGTLSVTGTGTPVTNQTVGSGAFQIIGDVAVPVVEADQTIVLGFDASGGMINPAVIPTHTYTILNDDTTSVSLSTPTPVTEGTGAGTTTVTLTVTQTNAVEGGFTLPFTTDDGTALASGDYSDADGSLAFSGLANTVETITVTINRDAALEGQEDFTVNLGTPVAVDTALDEANIAVAGSPMTVMINDDDNATLTLSGVTVTEGTGAGTTTATFLLTANNPVEGGFDVAFTVDDGTATAGTDYTDNDSTVTFTGNANETQTISVVINRDSEVEDTENFTVNLGTITPARAGIMAGDISTSGSPATGTITDDDSATVTISDVTVTEGTGGAPTTATFDVTLNNPVTGGFDLGFTVNDGTATSGVDYTASNSTLSFAGTMGETQQVTVNVTQDTVVEADETFTVTLGTLTLNDPSVDPSDVTVTPTSATGTIANDDTATLTIVDVTQTEGSGGGTNNFTFPVTLDAAVQGGFSIAYLTSDGTATVSGSDYVDNDGNLTFAGNVSESMNIDVAVMADSVVEPDETFTVTLGALSGLGAGIDPADIMIVDSPATGTVNNDDMTVLSVGSPTVSEGGANLTFPVTLTNPVQGGLSIDFTTNDGTATVADNDYQAVSGTATFAGTATAFSVMVPVNQDTVIEPDEALTVDLDEMTLTVAAGIDDATDITVNTSGTGTIMNDDTGFVSIVDMAALEGDGPGTTAFTFNVVLTDASLIPVTAAEDITVQADTADDSATLADGDYVQLVGATVTITAGSSLAMVTVQVNGDTDVEADETFFLNLSNIGGAVSGSVSFLVSAIQDDTGVGTIQNDD